MKKTINAFILIFTFLICVSLIGGAYALYVKNADNLEITFSAEPVEPWAAIDGGYYIVGQQFGGFTVNEKSILLNKDVSGSTDKAAIESVTLEAGKTFKVVKWTKSGGIDWSLSYNTGSQGVTTYCDSDGNVKANNTDNFFVCVNEWNQVWIQPTSTL